MENSFEPSKYIFGEYVKVNENSDGYIYATKLNCIVKSITMKTGKIFRSCNFAGEIYESVENGIRMTYKNSDYGNDAYFIEIHESTWNQLPEDYIYAANENGWNLVYSALDKVDCLKVNVNLPGSWLSLVERQARSI